MKAIIIDTRYESSDGPVFRDLPVGNGTFPPVERLGHVRAKEAADKLNAREADKNRFQVRLEPKAGDAVVLRSFGKFRKGIVRELRGRKRLEVRVEWANKKGEPHLYWYRAKDCAVAQERIATGKGSFTAPQNFGIC